MWKPLASLFLIFLFILLPPNLQAKQSLMVKNLTPQMGVNKQMADALSGIIKSKLSEFYDVQSMDALAAINNLVEEKLKAGCDDTKCIMEVAGALNIDRVVTGSISKFGKLYTLNLMLISTRGVNTGVIKRTSDECKCSDEELVGFAKRVALKLIGKEKKLVVTKTSSTSTTTVQKTTTSTTSIKPKTRLTSTTTIKLPDLKITPIPEPKGKSFINSVGQKFAWIESGTFMMGSKSGLFKGEKGRDKDEKQHEVTLTKGFYMQTTEVIQRQWREIMGNNPSSFGNCGDDCPVEKVSWEDCQDFIRRLNQKEGTGKYRLPKEAEWEYACRAGTTTPFAFGNCLSTDQANYNGNYPLSGCPKGTYRETTLPVASFTPNAWGLYDMHGNVWEWCQDWYGKNYRGGTVTDPEGPSSGSGRVLRGGSWYFLARLCRSANRADDSPGRRSGLLGFRLVKDK